ncbi:hypothetical protein JL720_12518 [Aureococcus anophagefferens]|nr:hypothetical protein JL720_12518 [Aureococcus anophagefferens]
MSGAPPKKKPFAFTSGPGGAPLPPPAAAAPGPARAEGPRLGDRLLETLRPHQVEGVSWVCARLWQNQGCVLADEMGLGKTATVLASLGVLMGVDGAAALETERSFRALRAFKARKRRRASARSGKYGDAARDDWDADPDDAVARFARAPLSSKPVLVISYESYRAKAAAVNAIKDVGLLVCDEAHRLKGGDDRVEAAAAIGDSPARKKLFVTATPVQNGVPSSRICCARGRARPASGDAAADARALRSALSARTLRRGVDHLPDRFAPA